MLPLYDGNNAPDSFRPEFNSGLWYDKFCNQWLPKKKEWSLGTDGKKNWINQLNEKKVGSLACLEEMIVRLGCLMNALKGEVRCLTTDWRFVTGLGREHPVENGFAWHHGLGVPYLPGSSIKGILRTWAEERTDLNQHEVWRIFGPIDNKANEKSIGSILFFDALPAEPVKVQSDVMTPHYAPYYLPQGDPQPPGDWFDPLPILFLTVAPGQPFFFALAPRRPDCRENMQDCMLVLQWLEEALAGIGAGAKTAAGYGRFTRRRDLEKKWSACWLKAEAGVKRNEVHCGSAREGVSSKSAPPVPESISIFQAAMEQDGYSSNPEQFMHALTTRWLTKMQSEQMDINGRREIAQLLADWYQRFKPDMWKKPNKKNITKIEEIKKTMAL